ncbi:MAG: HIT domain-containing protein [Thermoleophilia bacterium]|nr:HIT domain-containing protein [Thermoleophilia bacterium]
MKYEELKEFISVKMRMSHVYQPVMLISLLENNGRCHETQIASALLSQDQSQLEYYTKITNNMVGKVLRSHDVVIRDPRIKEYALIDYELLNEQQRLSLIDLCKKRLTDFVETRGKKIFDHRRKSSGYISGTIRYEVLKRAKFRCELCGISAYEKALEVDHIIPRNNGGSDDISNFQSLCYSCNSMKRDRDDTDFRAIRDSYDSRKSGCIFCETPEDRIIDENELANVIRDGFPVTEHHSLIIPKRHVSSYFDLGQSEINAINQLIVLTKNDIEEQDKAVTGFNVGINSGKSAGQTISHCHVHLIPRRDGDVENPLGRCEAYYSGKRFLLNLICGSKHLVH